MHYIALIGDIVDSRFLAHRKLTQDKLETLLEEINSSYSHSIAAKFLITIGDEFQGLLHPTSDAYVIATKICEQLYPIKIRFGLGYGQISTSLKEFSLGMDGPAFYQARNALDRLKNSKESAIFLAASTKDKADLKAINALFTSLFLLKQFWPENFHKSLPLLRSNYTQQEIAEALEITQGAVSRMTQRSKWRVFKEIEKDLLDLLERALSKL
jgi:plasmid maintenance system antidote protein VapI